VSETGGMINAAVSGKFRKKPVVIEAMLVPNTGKNRAGKSIYCLLCEDELSREYETKAKKRVRK
jgi:hypothetical protein